MISKKSLSAFNVLYFAYLLLETNAGSDLPKMLPISDEEKIVFATVGKAVVIRCPVFTKKSATFIEWSKGRLDLYNKDFEGYTVTDKGALKIRNVTMDNAGYYTCNATNGHGSISIQIRLIVSGVVSENHKADPSKNGDQGAFLSDIASNSFQVPRIEKPKISTFTEESGGSIIIRCDANGYPAPHIFWMKNGKLVDGSGIETKQSRSRSQSNLVLQKLRKSDAGIYKCIAKNELDKDQVDFTLNIVDQQYPPEILSLTPPNSTVIAGHMVVFRCKGRSLTYLKLHIKWMKTIHKDQANQSNRAFLLGSNYYKVLDTDDDLIIANNGRFQSELSIPNATIQDSGTYVCLVVNDKGYRYKNVSLKVLMPAKSMVSQLVTSATPSFVIFVIFATAVVVAPIAFLFFLYYRCRLEQKLNNTDASTEIESLRALGEPACDRSIKDNSKAPSIVSSSKSNHFRFKVLPSHSTEVYDCSCSL